MSAFSVVLMGSGLIDTGMKFLVPMFANHKGMGMIFTQIVIGTIFAVIYFAVSWSTILKFNYATPGREIEDLLEDDKDVSSASSEDSSGHSKYLDQARGYLNALGESENIASINNCATRFRSVVKVEVLVQEDRAFKRYSAHGVVRAGKPFQVIVGLDVQNVRAEFDGVIE